MSALTRPVVDPNGVSVLPDSLWLSATDETTNGRKPNRLWVVSDKAPPDSAQATKPPPPLMKLMMSAERAFRMSSSDWRK